MSSRCVDLLSLFRRVVVVQVLSLFVVVVRCSVFVVRCSAVLLVLFDYPELPGQSCTTCTVWQLRWQLNASPLFIRFLVGVASVSSAGGVGKMVGACRFLVPWETGSNRFSWRKWAAPDDFRPWEIELYRRSVLFAQQCCFSLVFLLENLT